MRKRNVRPRPSSSVLANSSTPDMESLAPVRGSCAGAEAVAPALNLKVPSATLPSLEDAAFQATP